MHRRHLSKHWSKRRSKQWPSHASRRGPPACWLFTDERMGDGLWRALARLPRGGGIVFRHYSLPEGERRALFRRVRHIARRRGLLLVLAGPGIPGRAGHIQGRHGAPRARHHDVNARLLHTAPVHDRRQMIDAERRGADALFLSPVLATRSHPGVRPLGRCRFAALARTTRLPVFALGGMNERQMRHMARLGAAGYAAIDAWLQEPGI